MNKTAHLVVYMVLVLVAVVAIGVFVAPRSPGYHYGVYYDVEYREAIPYRRVGDKIEIKCHYQWVDEVEFSTEHLKYHIELGNYIRDLRKKP